MATTVTITGSGTPIPSADRAGPGVLVEVGGVALQFDAGRNTRAIYRCLRDASGKATDSPVGGEVGCRGAG